VESTVDAGTAFSLLLPARIHEPGSEESILVAHGEQSERDYIVAALGGWGCNVVTAASSGDALALCRRLPLHAAFVDRGVIAADLPAWLIARVETPGLPLVLVSMSEEDGPVERFAREHASAVLAPPFQLRAIRSAVRAIAKECV
jgi:CheY-like chemotaxis protein